MNATALASAVPNHVDPALVHEFDMYEDAGIRRDLHNSYMRLHKEAPSTFWTPLNGGHWMVTSYDDITAVVMDNEHFSTKEHQIPRVPDAPRMIPLHVDPPENMFYRQLLMPYFSPKAVRAMDEQIEKQAHRFVDAIVARGKCEFVADVASQFPVTVFMILMGLPMDRFADFRDLVVGFFSNQGNEQKVAELSAAIMGEMEAVIAHKRENPADDLVTYLIQGEIKGRRLTQEELVLTTFLIFLGGMDTVTNAMSFTARLIATRPDVQRRVIEDPDCIGNFVEEALRLHGVVNVPRIVKKDVDMLGAKFRVNDMVLCTLPLAGRDPKIHDNPADFDIDRKDKRHLTFSTGAHLCLGHFLARAEMKKLFSLWFEKVGEYRLKPDQELVYRAGSVMSLEELHLEWGRN